MGEVINARKDIDGILDECRQKGSIPIIHTVYGSKTGICETFPHEYVDEVKS